MAKFNIEVELDWMDEEAYSIDDELREDGNGRLSLLSQIVHM